MKRSFHPSPEAIDIVDHVNPLDRVKRPGIRETADKLDVEKEGLEKYPGEEIRRMPNVVSYFEVTGKDGAALQKFYSAAFGWKIDPAPLSGYGFVQLTTRVSMRGGIGTAPPHSPSGVRFYVRTENMKATLRKIEKAGGKVLMPPTEIGGTTFALFADPEGHVVGLL